MRAKISDWTIILVGALCWTVALTAEASDFDSGYEEGYKAIRGDMTLVPLTPLPPLTPMGSTDFREGILQGIEDAEKDEYQNDPYRRER